MPEWLNFVKEVVALWTSLVKALLQNKFLRVIKKRLGKKYSEMFADIAEKKDDNKKNVSREAPAEHDPPGHQGELGEEVLGDVRLTSSLCATSCSA